MNNRRIFLSKDEVKKLGTELTEFTTDDIAVLYLPLTISSFTDSILFTYRTKTHEDFIQYVVLTYGNKYISIVNQSSIITLVHGGSLAFGYRITNSSANVVGTYNLYWSSLYSSYSTDSNSHTSTSSVKIDSLMDTSNLYIKIEIPKINMVVPGGAFTDFLIKYSSGTVPSDTIFYEPYQE